MPEEKEIEKPSYLGHRQRLKERFTLTGFSGFHDYEALEFLLYFVVPRKDTKPLAKALLERFGNFTAVLNADIKELQAIKGFGPHAAFFLKAVGATVGFYFDKKAKQEDMLFTDLETACGVFPGNHRWEPQRGDARGLFKQQQPPALC